MRRLLLVQPPTLARVRSGLYNLAALASYVENDVAVSVLDPTRASFEDALDAFSPDIIGVTSYTVTYAEAIEMMRTARRLAPGALRLIGGVHISCLPQSLDEVFDAGIIGDGEETLLDIVREATWENIHRIPGTCYRDNGGVSTNERPPVDVARLPVPRLHRYAPHAGEGGSAAFITSRGCPFRCAFCYSPVMLGNVRYYPPEWIAEQFEYAIKTLEADFLMILDDTVCLDTGRLHAIADALERRRLGGYRVAVNMRSSAVDEELCRALQRLRVVSWNCGFESGADRVLPRIKGGSASLAKHYEIVRLAHRYGVTLHGSFIFGMPGETIADMEDTLRFMEFLYREKCAGRYHGGFWFFCATPFPGTAWWDIARENGRVSEAMDWTQLDIKRWDNPLMLDASVSPEQFEDVRRRAADIVERANQVF